MNASKFYEVLEATGLRSLSIENGVFENEQVFPQNLNLTIEKRQGNIFIIAPKDCEISATNGIFSFGDFKCGSFTQMVITSTVVCFTGLNGKPSIHFFDSNEMISADEAIIIFDDFVWYKKNGLSRFRKSRLSITAPYERLGAVKLYGENSVLFSFQCRKGNNINTIVYNSKLMKEVFSGNADLVKNIRSINNVMLGIEIKGTEEKFLSADGKVLEKF